MIGPKTEVKEEKGAKDPERSGSIVYLPDGRLYDFTLEYDPAGAQGNGLLTITLGDQKATVGLTAAQRAAGADLNRFGMFNVQGNNGKFCEVFIDDLEFTVESRLW